VSLEEQRPASRCVADGSQQDLGAPGNSPRSYRINECGLFLVQGGLIVEQHGYWDSATKARQVGADRT
jgi:hypothetical protein